MTRLAVVLGGIITSHPSFTVAVWAIASLFTHSTVSPAFTVISAGEKTSLSMVTVIVSARPGTALVSNVAPATRKTVASLIIPSSLEFRGDMLRMLLVTLEQLQAGFEQALQFGVLGRGNEQGFKRAIDLLMEGDLIFDICLVKSSTLELGELGAFFLGSLGEGLGGVVVFRCDVEFLDQVERLLVDGFMVAQHAVGKIDHNLCVGLGDGQLGRLNIEHAGRIGDMGNLRIGRRVRGFREVRSGKNTPHGERRQRTNEHGTSLPGRVAPGLLALRPLDAW